MTAVNPLETVLTAIIDNEHRYGCTEQEQHDLVRSVVDVPHPLWVSLLFLWEKPCRSFRDEGGPAYPGHQLRVSTDPEQGWGALNYWHEINEGELAGWDSFNPDVTEKAPELWFDVQGQLRFPRNAALPLDEVRCAVEEFIRTGQRPSRIQWQEAKNY